MQGRCLFYPCAGADWRTFLEFFGDHVDEFHFCDIGGQYEDLGILKSISPFADASPYRLVTTEVEGKPKAQIQPRTAGRPYRELEPGRPKQVYERGSDGRRLIVVRRRGFGQYALGEFPNRSIGVFVHRGDSRGEGGFDTYFLANKNRHHEPLTRLFDKLSQKLRDRALIISDGSLVDQRLKKKSREQQFVFGDFEWRHAGFIGGRDPPTPIWDVVRRVGA
jgi:hypothetical protein